MEHLTIIFDCLYCGRTSAADPQLVPSVRLRGKRQPICRECAETVQRGMRREGREPIEIPKGAYR